MNQIIASQALKRQSLTVTADGIVYAEGGTVGTGKKLRYTFGQIDAVVKSTTEPVLSIQIGSVVHSIPIRKDDANHRAIIEQIVAGAQRSLAETPQS
jgi:hypothetical protein